jgi:DNA-binding XRE family transcriptional regulator
MYFNKTLFSLRTKRKLPQEELAYSIGVSR